MTRIRSNRMLLWTVVLMTSAAGELRAESRFAVPFENFRRTHDRSTFGTEKRKALEKPTSDFGEDIAYLIAVCADKKEEPILQDKALEELFFIAFQMSQFTTKPIDAFRPAMPVFEGHFDEAMGDVKSKWNGMLLSLTALAGLQPSPKVIPLFYRVLDDKYAAAMRGQSGNMTNLALMALARLNPRPAEAKRILLQHAPKFDRDERIEILAFALDDPDFLAIFAKSLESTEVYEQWRATKYLVHVGVAAKPALEMLRRLQQRADLDKEVAANVKTAIDQIEGTK